VRSRCLAPFLICALLALPGCGIVKGAVKRSLTRVISGAIAAALFGSDEAAAEDEFVEEDDTTVAEEDDGGFFGGGEDEESADSGSGFYKVVEPNGTVRFVSNLSEVPVAQRPKAEKLAMEPSGGDAKGRRRPPSREATKQLAVAKNAPPAAIPEPDVAPGRHDVVVYTTSWCGYCKKTIAWLEKKGIDYENRDVERNEEWAEEMHDLTGSGSVPVIVIDGEVIRGFNQAELERRLRG
jgi:mycoredoxin